jgi:hypothetical protein
MEIKHSIVYGFIKISFICLLFFAMSCQKNERAKIEVLVKEWNNKEIRFPDNPVFTRFVTDTVPYRIPKSDYKVVVFVDSVGCISCKLQLPKWKEFMHEVDSLSDGNVPFVFFFQTKDVSELRYILKRDNFSHPVCMDTEDSFYRLNRFPGEMMFQTFLVDSANRVKVIGNPIHNLSVKDLYLKEITGIEAVSQPVTTIQADSAEYHYGVVGENKTASRKIILRNTGKEVFRIKGTTTSCDCMTAEYDWDEIPPGGKAAMTVEYKAEEPGDFWRTITIYGNIPEKSFTLDFWGTVKK